MSIKSNAKRIFSGAAIAAAAVAAPMAAQSVTVVALPADSPISAAVQVLDQTPTAEAGCREYTYASGRTNKQGCTKGFAGPGVVAAQGDDVRSAAPLAILNNGSTTEVADSGTVTAGGGASVGDTVKAVPLTCGRVDEKGAASAPNSTATSGGDWVLTLPTKGGPC